MFLQFLHLSHVLFPEGMPGADHEPLGKVCLSRFQMYLVSTALYHIVAKRPDTAFCLKSTSLASHTLLLLWNILLFILNLSISIFSSFMHLYLQYINHRQCKKRSIFSLMESSATNKLSWWKHFHLLMPYNHKE